MTADIEVCFTHTLYDDSTIPAEYSWRTHRTKKTKYEFQNIVILTPCLQKGNKYFKYVVLVKQS